MRIGWEALQRREVELLTTIPGVGAYSALLIYAEIGDVGRFPNAERLASYAGLVPGVEQSGSVVRRRGITRRGNPLLRWILVEAVWSHLRCAGDTCLTRFYRRIAWRKGGGARARKQAAVATARKLLHVIYAMLRDGKPFMAQGMEAQAT